MNHSKDIQLARRALEVTPFQAMEIMERAKELEASGREIIYLCLGEPDFPTPEPIMAAVRQALNHGDTCYTHSLGSRDLRDEIVAHYQRRYQVTIEAEQIIVSSGTSPLMLLLFGALLEAGDEVILTDPGYACYPNFVRFYGGKPVWLHTRAEDGFQPDPANVRPLLTARTRAILINSPANPAGTIIPPDWLRELAALPTPLISDEIYHGLTYEGEEHSVLEYTHDAFVLGGFSKTYAMTGWRLGYLIAPRSCMRTLQSLHQNFVISANSFVQQAGIAALRDCDADVARMRAAYNQRRHRLVAGLREIGFGVHGVPSGAFYVLADARQIDGDSRRLARDILEKTGVAVTPGVDFGSGAEGFLRFSYANSIENIERALTLIGSYLSARK